MEVKRLVLGPIETNTYILENNDSVLIIDPADEASTILEQVKNKKVLGIIVTHYHFDHIGALDEVSKEMGTKTYDYKNLKEGTNKIGPFQFECIYLPGHKEDLIGIYFKDEKMLFAGDFIFEGTIGRCDLEGGSFRDTQKSISKILEYPLDIKIYPGHGPTTSLAREKDNLKKYL